MDGSLTTGDLALLDKNNDWGGNSFFWIFALLILAGGGFNGFGFGNRNSELSQYASSAQAQDILFTQKFDALGQKVNAIGDGICSSTYALNNAIKDGNAAINANVVSEGRAIQTQFANCCCENQKNVDALRYDMAQGFANTNATTTMQTQKILDALAQNKIDSLQAQVSELKTQNMFCGIPRISNYAYGVVPTYSGCGCNNI